MLASLTASASIRGDLAGRAELQLSDDEDLVLVRSVLAREGTSGRWFRAWLEGVVVTLESATRFFWPIWLNGPKPPAPTAFSSSGRTPIADGHALVLVADDHRIALVAGADGGRAELIGLDRRALVEVDIGYIASPCGCRSPVPVHRPAEMPVPRLPSPKSIALICKSSLVPLAELCLAIGGRN